MIEDDWEEFDRMLELLDEGSSLNFEDALQLEQTLLKNPKGIEPRIKLLSYYRSTRQRSDTTVKARFAHIVWLVDNCPEHSICGHAAHMHIMNVEDYENIRAKWIAHIERNPTNAKILSNAAFFLKMHSVDPSDDKLAEYCLLECTRLEPSNIFWSRRLSRLYDRSGVIDARKSFEENARIVKITSAPEDLFYVLLDFPLRAIRACAYNEASIAAEKLLLLAEELKDEYDQYGDAIQNVYTTLGLLALREGDVSKAKDYLEQSIIKETTTQIQLNGPRFELAEKLLEHGEKQAVLEYLNSCEPLCEIDKTKFLAFRKRLN